MITSKRKTLRDKAIEVITGTTNDIAVAYDPGHEDGWSGGDTIQWQANPYIDVDWIDARTPAPIMPRALVPPPIEFRDHRSQRGSLNSLHNAVISGVIPRHEAQRMMGLPTYYDQYGGGPPKEERSHMSYNTKYQNTFNSTNENVWGLLDEIAPYAKRVLLYGPPGTGKSYIARSAGVSAHSVVHPAPIHEDLPAAELRGHFIPTESGGLRWMDGPVIAAWRDGGRLVLDEIDKLSADGMSFLLAALDDVETARIELGTTNEILTPHPDLTVWATMNGEPRDLPDALLDRFVVRVHITAPHPAAIAALPADLRDAATALAVVKDSVRRVGLRAFMEFSRLREAGLNEDKAGFLTFGEKWGDVQEARIQAKAVDLR